MLQRFTTCSAIAFILASLVSPNARSASAEIFATWTSATNGFAAGTLNGTIVTATFSNLSPPIVNIYKLSTFDLSNTATFNPPGSSSQQTIEYPVKTQITWTFSNPISNLSLYTIFWRGNTGVPGERGPTDGRYTFDASPTIASGLSNTSISGNSLIVGSDMFYSGILQFAGPLTSLTLFAPAGASASLQAFTLAVVPEPSTYAMALAGLACGGFSMWRRRKRA